MTPDNDEPAGIDFLDFLFTVAISVGLTPELLGRDNITGILSEDWARKAQLPSGQDLFNFGVFCLGFVTLTLSWFGYHGSIRSKPLQYGTFPGMIRFIFDVLLVVMYGVILLYYRHFRVVISLIVLAHLIFVIWDCLKIVEHWNKYQAKAGPHLRRYRREYVSLVSLGLWLLLLWRGTQWLSDSLSLFVAIVLTFFYRINKEFPTWERLFGVDSD
jgi:hypothetical protein